MVGIGLLHTTYIPPLVETVVAQEMTLMEEAELNIRTFTPEELEEIARAFAREYEIDEQVFVDTLACESLDFTWNDQSLVIQKDGTREPSYGIAQFYMPSVLKKPNGEVITKEEALKPYVAIETAAYNFSIGNAYHWTCYHKHK